MKCFHFSNGEKEENGIGNGNGNGFAVSRVSWVRSFSVASSNLEARRSEFDTDSNDVFDVDFRRNDLRVFEFSQLRLATRGFSRALMIGEGGFGCVYRGVVTFSDDSDEKMDVAVKQLNRNGLQKIPSSYDQTERLSSYIPKEHRNRSDPSYLDHTAGHKEWVTEVNFLGVVNHPNLVKLVGYCAEDDERGIQRLLVYEFMPNKSLEDHLLARMPESLPWATRLRVVRDAARGLTYLHEEMDFQLIFRDFKTSNILLDKDFNAKLSDFGLVRQGPTEGLGHVYTSVVGTVGYAAPEYVRTGRLTAKSDVWSFGVVLYEVITGRRSVDRNRPRSEQKLLEWVKPYVSDAKKVHIILDPRLEGQFCTKSVQKLVLLANKCLAKQPKSRPKMSEVVDVLGQIIEMADGGREGDMNRMQAVEKESLAVNETAIEGSDSNAKKVFDFREFISLRNKAGSKLDWRSWTPALVRTS